MKHDYIIMVGLIALSVLTSFLLTFYGMNIVMSGKAPGHVMTFAYVTIAYGLGNLAVLSLAWSSREVWSIKASMLFALCFLGVYIMDLVRNGLKEGFGIAGVLVLAVVLFANWYAVKMVVERK